MCHFALSPAMNSVWKCELKEQWDITIHLLEWLKSRTLTISRVGDDVEYQNLRFNAIPIKIPMPFFKERTNNFKTPMGTQKTLNSQNNVEKEGQCWRYHTPWFQTILHSYGKKERKKNQYGTGMKTPSLKEQNKEPRNNDSDRLSPQFNWCQRRQ